MNRSIVLAEEPTHVEPVSAHMTLRTSRIAVEHDGLAVERRAVLPADNLDRSSGGIQEATDVSCQLARIRDPEGNRLHLYHYRRVVDECENSRSTSNTAVGPPPGKLQPRSWEWKVSKAATWSSRAAIGPIAQFGGAKSVGI